jgi:hypothetical protein
MKESCSTELVNVLIKSETYCTSSALTLESLVVSNVPEGSATNTLHSNNIDNQLDATITVY